MPRCGGTILVCQYNSTISGTNRKHKKRDGKFKAQGSIQGDQLRVSGKSRDELQAAIAALRGHDFGLPIQFNNFRD